MSRHMEAPVIKLKAWVAIALAIFISAEVGSAGAIIVKMFFR